MRHPIRYALCWPDRPPAETGFDLTRTPPLTFEAADPVRFSCLRLAREAAARGGTAPAILNGANEAAVEAFLGERIRFLEIAEVIEETLGRASIVDDPSEEDVFAADREARRLAREIGLAAPGREH
jgi:1-deoxy-D-xylulose-5-phosphate reductoisomerase